jgi:hypothetical protein
VKYETAVPDISRTDIIRFVKIKSGGKGFDVVWIQWWAFLPTKFNLHIL